MKQILAISANTQKELIRDKTLYALFFFTIALLAMSLLISELSANENIRLVVDFGFSCILISICILTLFIGGTLVFREIDKKTILFLMSYPISRTQFLLGKFLGFVRILVFLLLGLGVLLFLLLFALGWSFNISYLIALYGIFLEMCILLSFTICLSTLVRPFLVIGSGIGIFIIGHVVSGFYILAHSGQNVYLRHFSSFLVGVMPNFENMNWMNNVIYGDIVSVSQIVAATIYAIGWSIFFLVLSTVFFRRNDFV